MFISFNFENVIEKRSNCSCNLTLTIVRGQCNFTLDLGKLHSGTYVNCETAFKYMQTHFQKILVKNILKNVTFDADILKN